MVPVVDEVLDESMLVADETGTKQFRRWMYCKLGLHHRATIFYGRGVFFHHAVAPQHEFRSMSLPSIRRNNVLILFGDFVAAHAAHGAEPLGLAAKFAETLQVSPSMWSQIKKGRVISDKLARQIEAHCGKPALWLDAVQSTEPLPDPGEERFIELARQAYRAQNARGKRALRTVLLEHIKPPPGPLS